MEEIKTIIIEDEELARDIVKKYLADHPRVKIIKECDNGFEGIKAIQELKPDLIFLDIQMPKLNGFEMLEILDEKPEIIFTTAFNQYAIKAFELNAIDYLLKPFSKERLNEALTKAILRIDGTTPKEKNVHKLAESSLAKYIERLVVKTGTKIKVVPIDKVNYFEAQDDYVMIYTNEGKHLKQTTMKHLETNLEPSVFARVHRSYIVRIDQVEQLEHYSKDTYIAKMRNGAKIKVSKAGMKSLKNKLDF